VVAGFQDGDCPSAGEIAFRIAPRINAAGRMADAAEVVEMFLTDDQARAADLAGQLHELNKERQETEADIVRRIEEECTRTPVADTDSVLVFSGEGWHRGVVGIVASRIVERYHRPAFVLSEDALTGAAHGSGRSIRQFHLLDALESMPDLFTKFGGHRQAAGLTLPCASVQEFRERLNRYAAELLTVEDFVPTIEVDAVLKFTDLNETSAAQILSLAPFGCGNPAPAFAVLDAEIAGPPSIGEKLVTVPVRQNGRMLFLKSWRYAERWRELPAGSRVDLAIAIEEDNFSASRGYPGWCAVIKDFRRTAGALGAPA
jgi:single-stranded-DNA-specific exonuclease